MGSISGVGDGLTDDIGAVQAAIDAMAALGGGEVTGLAGAVYRCSVAPVVKERVRLNLQGATILQTLTAPIGEAAHGMRLKSHASVCHGEVHTKSSNAPDVYVNGSVHAAVSIGPGYGTGGTVAAPSEFEDVHDWHLHDLELSTDKNIVTGGKAYGGTSIQVCGNAYAGVIERVRVPDSPVQAGGINLDWGYLGPLIMNTDNPAQMQLNKTAYFANNVRTTHPHDIIIRDNHIGKLTKPQAGDLGGHGIRLSAVYGVKVQNNLIDAASYIGIFHHGGDYGFEFSEVLARRFAIRGNEITGNIISQAGPYGILVDGYGDNVFRAFSAGYDKIIHPIMPTNLKVCGNLVNGQTGNPNTAGLFYQYLCGGRFEDNVFLNCGSYITAGPSVSSVALARNMGGAETPAFI